MSERWGHTHALPEALWPTRVRRATLYIINLLSSDHAMTLEVPYTPELEGFAVFRSRRVRGCGTAFDCTWATSIRRASRAVLGGCVRATPRGRWVAPAPKDAMGSLDDNERRPVHN